MGIKLTNNAFGTLAAGINSSATSITLTSGQGARFPTLSAGDYFYATLIDTSNNLEIVKCTARSTDVLTVVRAQESTTARAYTTGDRIEIRLTAQTFVDSAGVEKLPLAGGTMTGPIASAVSATTATETNVVALVDSVNSANKLGRIASYNDGGYYQDLRLYTTNASGSAERLTKIFSGKTLADISLGHAYGTWTETVQTVNGGSQTVRIIEDCYGRWVLVGRFAADASVSIAGVWSSVRGLSTALDQNTTAFSADFGDTYPSEVRVLGSTDFAKWKDNRTIDFVYKVPSGRPWKNFFNNNSTTGNVMLSQIARKGFATAGTYDGFGRWNNPLMTEVGISDVDYACPTAAFTTPTSNAFDWDSQTGSTDAKLITIHTGGYASQDNNSTTGFGKDDNVRAFFDAFPNTVSNLAGGTAFSSAVWILLKLN